MITDLGFAPIQQMLSPTSLAAMLGISERHLADVRHEDPSFPAPVMLGTLPRWSPATILRWMDRPLDGDASTQGVVVDRAMAADLGARRSTKKKGAPRVH